MIKENGKIKEISENEAFCMFVDNEYYIAIDFYEFRNRLEESGAKITKITKNINTATTNSNMLLIKSSDNSIQGYWSIDDKGVRILNLIAESSITD